MMTKMQKATSKYMNHPNPDSRKEFKVGQKVIVCCPVSYWTGYHGIIITIGAFSQDYAARIKQDNGTLTDGVFLFRLKHYQEEAIENSAEYEGEW